MKWLVAAWLVMQAPQPAQPPGIAGKLSAPPRYTLPPFHPVEQPESGRMQAGRHRPLPAGALKKGKWYRSGDGRRLWRLELEAPGAAGMRLHFVKFAAGEGQVWLYSKADPHIGGPYTRTGIDASGDFWSDSIEGASLIVEFAAPSGYKAKMPPFQIPEISHLYRRI